MDTGYDKHRAEQRTMRVAIVFACLTVFGLAALMVVGTNASVFMNYLLGYPSPASARIDDRAGGAGGAASPPASATEEMHGR